MAPVDGQSVLKYGIPNDPDGLSGARRPRPDGLSGARTRARPDGLSGALDARGPTA